jgi:hypothetical protein
MTELSSDECQSGLNWAMHNKLTIPYELVQKVFVIILIIYHSGITLFFNTIAWKNSRKHSCNVKVSSTQVKIHSCKHYASGACEIKNVKFKLNRVGVTLPISLLQR